MSEPLNDVYIAAIVAVSSMFGPMVMAWITNRYRRQEKLEDYARQDEVARRVEQVADHAATAALSTSVKLDSASDKLDLIHSLVNSNMTTALQAEYDAMTRELAMMREVMELNRVAGREPSAEALTAIKVTEKKISELRSVLEDRSNAQAKINAAT